MDRAELAGFLRTRRARLQPGDVGLEAHGCRRRTPGLRREEVAQLAGISVDYYTRLEQERGPRPSRQVLDSLARALRMSGDERSHLYHLAGDGAAAPDRPGPEVAPGILRLLARLDDTPAAVVDAKYDMLAHPLHRSAGHALAREALRAARQNARSRPRWLTCAAAHGHSVSAHPCRWRR